MARNFSPRGRIERREQQDLSLFSGVTPRESKCKVSVAPGQHGAKRGKLSEYGKQFRAKQLAKRMYGVLERQFKTYFVKASAMKGSTGESLLRFLEMRLDNIVFRLGFARTRKEARQLVSHRSISVNNGKEIRTVNLPSYQLKAGDEVIIREKCQKQGRIQQAMEMAKQRVLSEWLDVKPEEYKGIVRRIPERSEMPLEINESLIVELYSK
ncbi:MAG: 30S ribosomal protein S4 [Gammaproteobacteria bacterium GWE2_42_36]|nr:MAG: 30S ribosomal protein S4 [Gammaproteobacteria bacterium GWE2_42_36]HCU05586.1 30S ribosomal protein S4 [Coxiellaceae bacterium]